MIRPTRWPRQRRHQLSLALIALIALALGSLPLATTNAQDATPRLDLTALVISPLDTGDQDYRTIEGIACFSPKACADPNALSVGDEEGLTEATLERAYGLIIARYDPELPLSPQRYLSSQVLEFADAAGAEASLAAVLQGLGRATEPTTPNEPIGDEAETLAVAGDADVPGLSGSAGIRFRIGRYVVGVQQYDMTGEDSDAAEVDRFARVIEQRIAESDQTSRLGALVVHHRASTIDYYDQLDGEPLQQYIEDDDGFARRSEELEQFGVVDLFHSQQSLVAAPDEFSFPAVELTIKLYQLADEERAEAFFDDYADGLPDEWKTNDLPYESLDVAEIGDDVRGYLFAFSTASAGARIVVRSDGNVADITWQRYLPAGEEFGGGDLLATIAAELVPGATYTAKEQVTCLEADDCPGLTKLSKKLLPPDA